MISNLQKNISHGDVFLCYTSNIMDWSTKRKMGCFGVVGIVIFIITGIIAYQLFIKTTPTCFDGEQNQNEQGIDCGGICTKICSSDTRSIVSFWSQIFQITPGVYSTVAYLENQNSSAGIEVLDYEFRIYDQENLLATEPIRGRTFVAPNDKLVIFESPLKLGNRIPQQVFFSIIKNPTWMKVPAEFQVPQLTSGNLVWSDVETAPKLSAEITNTSLKEYVNIPVTVIVYDEKNIAIHASQTFIDHIAGRSTSHVFFTWPAPFEKQIVRTEIVPRLNPFIQK